MFGRERASVPRASTLVLVMAPAMIAAACGVRTPLGELYEEPPPVSDDSGVHVMDASLPPFDAGTAADTSKEDAGPDVALPATDLGNIVLTSGAYVNRTIQTLTASASFFPSVAATGCSVAAIAGCTLETCVSGDPLQLANAGLLLITGGTFPLTLEQARNGPYGPASSSFAPFEDGGTVPSLWMGGETLVVNAGGGVVPAFVASVVAPRQVVVVTPIPSTLQRKAPFTFSWIGASAGKVAFDLSVEGTASDEYLECLFENGAGGGAVNGTVPAEALSALPSGAGRITVSTESRSDVNAGPWAVRTFLGTNAADQTGAEYTGTVELQ